MLIFDTSPLAYTMNIIIDVDHFERPLRPVKHTQFDYMQTCNVLVERFSRKKDVPSQRVILGAHYDVHPTTTKLQLREYHRMFATDADAIPQCVHELLSRTRPRGELIGRLANYINETIARDLQLSIQIWRSSCQRRCHQRRYHPS